MKDEEDGLQEYIDDEDNMKQVRQAAGMDDKDYTAKEMGKV